MKKHNFPGMVIAGFCAGAVAGLFAAGGGMVLIPLLSLLTDLDDSEIFASSVAIILPICIVTLVFTALTGTVAWGDALPWLFGSAAGGCLAGRYGKKIPAVWLHRGLGILIIWGGIRYLC